MRIKSSYLTMLSAVTVVLCTLNSAQAQGTVTLDSALLFENIPLDGHNALSTQGEWATYYPDDDETVEIFIDRKFWIVIPGTSIVIPQWAQLSPADVYPPSQGEPGFYAGLDFVVFQSATIRARMVVTLDDGTTDLYFSGEEDVALPPGPGGGDPTPPIDP